MKHLLPAAILMLSCSWAGAQTAGHEVKKPKTTGTSGNNSGTGTGNNTGNNTGNTSGSGGESTSASSDTCPAGTHRQTGVVGCMKDTVLGGNATSSAGGGIVAPDKPGHKTVTSAKDSTTPPGEKPVEGGAAVTCSGHPPLCAYGTKRKCDKGAWACQPSDLP